MDLYPSFCPSCGCSLWKEHNICKISNHYCAPGASAVHIGSFYIYECINCGCYISPSKLPDEIKQELPLRIKEKINETY